MYTIHNKGHSERKSHFKKRRLKKCYEWIEENWIAIQGGVDSNLKRGDNNPWQVAIKRGG